MKKQSLQAEVAAIKDCAIQKDLHRGVSIHAAVLKRGLLGKSSYLGNTLISMYAKCGVLSKAHCALEEMATRDVVSWTALIMGYAQQSQGYAALHCLEQMQGDGHSPNAVTFCSLLKACGSIGAADKGEQIQNEISKQPFLANNLVLGNALVDMYSKCGDLVRAEQYLMDLPVRDIVSWTTLIAGYNQQGRGWEALLCFDRMQWEGFPPNATTFICALKACSSVCAINRGTQIHIEIVRQGLLESEVMLGNAVVSMYAKCGYFLKAEKALKKLHRRDTNTWNGLMAGYAQGHGGHDALHCYKEMQGEGLSPDAVTFISGLKACGSIEAVEKGQCIHIELVRQGLIGDNVVLCTALVDMYAKCSDFLKATQVLEESCVWDVVAWNALIAGYIRRGLHEKALHCFQAMQCMSISADEVTFVCILKACSSIGAGDEGKHIHDEMKRQGLLWNSGVMSTALLNMYMKCGELAKAELLLEELPSPDVASWSALAGGYAQIGSIDNTLNCIEQMLYKGLFPNAITLSSVLYACSHSGLVEEGQMYFAILTSKFGIMPDSEHYACMVDLLGRAGRFKEAMSLIQWMPYSDFLIVWSALMGACQKWGNVNVGRWAFEHAIQIDCSIVAAHLSMARICLSGGMCFDPKAIEFTILQQ